MEQFTGYYCPPRKSLKFISLLLMFLVATMCPSCTYSNTIVGTAATSSASSSAASAHKKVSGNQNTENIDKLVDDHLSSAEARALYEKANLFNYGSVEVQPNVERAEALYRKASELTGPFAAASLNALAKLAKSPKDKLYFFNQSAMRGNPNAHFMMGVFHSTGLFSTEINQAKALLHFHFAAIGNETKGAMAAGYRTHYGVGVPKDCERASLYYELAANAVIDEADRKSLIISNEQKILSDAFYKSNNKNNDDAEVVQYFQYAADKNLKRGLIGLGQLYYYGSRGLKRNFLKAFHLFKTAATKHSSGSGYANMGHMYLNGFVTDEIENMDSKRALSPTSSTANAKLNFYDDDYYISFERRPKYDKAKEMFTSAVQAGNSYGYAGLGVMFLWGLGIEQNIPHAMHLLKKAADAGNAYAHYSLGVLNLGFSIPNTENYRNFRTAAQHFQVAAQAGHLHAQHRLANMHLHGVGMEKNCQAAVRLFKKVAESGNNVVKIKRAHALLTGNSKYTEYNDDDFGAYDREQRALVLYAMAAEMGFQRAQENAAWVYEKILKKSQKDVLGLALPSVSRNRNAGMSVLNTDSEGVDGESSNEKDAARSFGLRMWELAAAQGNIRASLRVGDFFYYGLSGTPVSYKDAAAQYQKAASLGSAQAMFNLGYMHQLGLGFHAKDFHLAKRQYDTAIAKNREAYVPCTLALHYLYFQSAWETSLTWMEFFGCLRKTFLAQWIYPKQFELFLGSKKL